MNLNEVRKVIASGTQKLNVNQLVEELRRGKKTHSINENAEPEALKQSFFRYLKNGNNYTAVGDVELAEDLVPSAYTITQNMAGDPVFERRGMKTDGMLTFEDHVLDRVVKEVDTFWERVDKYKRLGIMHSRGILMYGPPGTGKSIAMQQCVEMMSKRGDVVFFANNPHVIAPAMKAFRQIEESRPTVICFEEADEMANYNEREMLRIMDGDAKIDGVLYLATTNYIERLPERMLRPGRFDKKIYVAPPKLEHRLKYLKAKLEGNEDASEKLIQELAEKTEGMGFGHLRELIAGVFAIGDDLDSVITRLKEGFHDPYDPNLGSIGKKSNRRM